MRPNSAKQLPARRNSAEGQSSAKFDAIRAAALRRHRCFKSFNADFEQAFSGHGKSLAPAMTCVSVPLLQSQIIPSSAAAFQPHKNRRISLGL